MKQFYEIDEQGYYIQPVILNAFDNVNGNCVELHPPHGLFKPKWTGAEWIEGKTEEEFLEDEFLESLNPSAQDLAKAERDLETIELLIEMGLIQ